MILKLMGVIVKISKFFIILSISETCSICQENCLITTTESINEISLLMCGHFFHEACIKKWANNEANSCPLCKKKVKYCNLEAFTKNGKIRDLNILFYTTLEAGSELFIKIWNFLYALAKDFASSSFVGFLNELLEE